MVKEDPKLNPDVAIDATKTDIDTPNNPVVIPGFQLSLLPVTVGEYSAFIENGGYEDPDYWSDEAWVWRLRHIITSPRWWEASDPEWSIYLGPKKPVVGVSWFEAQAYCRWGARRLPTEMEWMIAAGLDRVYPWGDERGEDTMSNRNIGERCTWDVDAHPKGAGPFGHQSLAGNIWQWTNSEWPDEGQIHYIVKGGSWASPDRHCTNRHRNAYAPEGRWSHVGFRTCAL